MTDHKEIVRDCQTVITTENVVVNEGQITLKGKPVNWLGENPILNFGTVFVKATDGSFSQYFIKEISDKTYELVDHNNEVNGLTAIVQYVKILNLALLETKLQALKE
jgi:hypothetical protein